MVCHHKYERRWYMVRRATVPAMRSVDLAVANEQLQVVMHAARLALVFERILQRDRAGRARRHGQPKRHCARPQLAQQTLLSYCTIYIRNPL